MRRNRRGGGSHEFGGSGEDSFVAVVVTKLTGALLFILLMVMVIMALLPKAVDLAPSRDQAQTDPPPATLAITTPEDLPEAIAGRPYQVALAVEGAAGPVSWSIDGPLPDGLTLDPETGRIAGVANRGTAEPAALHLVARQGGQAADAQVRLVVWEAREGLTLPSKWAPKVPSIPWKSWLDQGFGFLVIILVAIAGLGAIREIEGRRGTRPADAPGLSRFRLYRWLIRLSTAGALASLAVWMVLAHR